MTIFKNITLISTLLLSSVAAENIVIDFEGEEGCSPALIKSGIKVTSSGGSICVRTPSLGSISNGTVYSNDTLGMNIVHIQGDTFTPISIDLAERSISFAARETIRFTGVKLDGSIVTYNVTIDGEADSTGGIDDFETFTFPANFSDIVSLASAPRDSYSMDNIIIDTAALPEFPTNQGLGSNYSDAQFLFAQQFSFEDNLIIGEDFHYSSGFSIPDQVVFLEPNRETFTARYPYYNPTTDSVVYVSGNDILQRDRENFATIVSISDVVAEGFTVNELGPPVINGDRLIFEAYDFSGADSFYIFERIGTQLNLLVGPNTQLPNGTEESLPFNFPDFRAIGDKAYAFETSLEGSTSLFRIFVKWGSNDFNLVLTEGDATEFGNISFVSSLSFDDNNVLNIEVETSQGSAILRYNSDGIIGGDFRSVEVETSPIDAGITISGSTIESAAGTRFLLVDQVLYQEHEGNYFKVIGLGDQLDGRPIDSLRFMDVIEGSPERVIVDIGFAGSFDRLHYIVTLAEPVDALPHIGKFNFFNDGRLYLPLSHLTLHRSYRLETSTNITEWRFERNIENIVPLQYIIIEPPFDTTRFYRIVESN